VEKLRVNPRLFLLLLAVLLACRAQADLFVLPTPNQAIFQSGGEATYFAPTPGRTWESGTFGCVRTGGMQMHEGLDIRATARNKAGEPTDPIIAAAPGKVAYLNQSVGLSNYGKYVILEHLIEGMPVYTLYAHLSAIAPHIKLGTPVAQGERIATMGRTSNIRGGIGKDRAHLHFEVVLRVNERFATWFKARTPTERNDHGNWNGRNLLGLDPRALLVESKRKGNSFSLTQFIRERTELCRVLVRDTQFPWLRQHVGLIRRNPVAERDGVVAYEIALDFNGVPFQLVPRAATEVGSGPKVQLLSVNDREQSARPCRKLVSRQSGQWQLGRAGTDLLDLLVY